jgi:hypothetical protein
MEADEVEEIGNIIGCGADYTLGVSAMPELFNQTI